MLNSPAFAPVILAIAILPARAADFDAPKYGVKAAIPDGWEVVVREEDDRVFVARIPQHDPESPGVAACELGLAPENLDEYRTRIDAGAKRGAPGKLARNEVVRTPRGERLETLREFRPRGGGLWRELTVRMVANRQMYTFMLNADEATYPAAKDSFDAMVDSAAFAPPDTGADRPKAGENRWVQREFKFALGLPEGWAPALAPSEVALLFADGPPSGIWSDNVLVLAQPHRPLDLAALARDLPDDLRKVEPGCEVVSCKVVPQGAGEALETVVRTTRGPFSMTILERRFAGDRFDYEVKATVETGRFDALEPALRKSLDSFEEVPGDVPAAPGPRKRAA